MSPSPTNRVGHGLAIGLCPETVGIVRLGGWHRTRVDGREIVEVAEPSADGMAALAALKNWLQQHRSAPAGHWRWLRPPVSIVLSDRLVRYARIPWSGGTLSPQEEEALSRACFEERYGDMNGWTVRCEAARYGQGRLAGAVPSELMGGLQRLLLAHRLDCRAVTPYFVTCWNRWRREIVAANGKADALFAVADAEAAVIGVTDGTNGGLRSLRSLRMRNGECDLAEVTAREALLQGLADPAGIWVHSPQPGMFAATSDKVHVLSMAPGVPTPIAMAMSGFAS